VLALNVGPYREPSIGEPEIEKYCGRQLS